MITYPKVMFGEQI